MRLTKKILIVSIGSTLGLLVLTITPVFAASTFNDGLWQFAGGNGASVIDFNNNSTGIWASGGQLTIATPNFMNLAAGQRVTVSNALVLNNGPLIVNGTAQVNNLNGVNSVNSSGTMTDNGLLTVGGGANITGNLTLTGGTVTFGSSSTSPVHLITAQTTAPTASVSIAGLTSASVAGTDTSGVITTSGAVSGSGTITVTFNTAYAAAPYVNLTAANLAAANSNAFVSSTTGGFTISTSAEGTGTPSWYYIIVQ